MADHMRRNDKLQSLTASAQRSSRPQASNRSQASGRHQASGRSQTGSPRRPERRYSDDSQRGRVTTGEFFKRNATYILSVVAVAVLVVLMIFFIRACAPQEEQVDDQGPSYTSPYDWTKLDHSNNRFAYVVNGQVKSRIGIDVSESQLDIDWQAVAADDIDFAMIRLGYRGAT